MALAVALDDELDDALAVALLVAVPVEDAVGLCVGVGVGTGATTTPRKQLLPSWGAVATTLTLRVPPSTRNTVVGVEANSTNAPPPSCRPVTPMLGSVVESATVAASPHAQASP